MYVYDCNVIMTTAINTRSDKEMMHAFTKLTTYLKTRGINPGFHFMDNESSEALKMAMATMDINYQLVPPSQHRANNAERAIHTFKNHVTSGLCVRLCSVDENLHLQLWDILLHKSTISLNLIQKSRLHPHLSAYTHIFGYFIYNYTQLAPLGERVGIHNRQKDRK